MFHDFINIFSQKNQKKVLTSKKIYIKDAKHDGGVAELVDALDSKSCFLWKYEFKSHHPYQ